MSPISLPARRTVVERIRWRLLASSRDLVVFAISTLLAFELRFDGALPAQYYRSLETALCVWAGAKTIAFTVGAVNRAYWQNTSIYDAKRIALANSAGSVLGGLTLVI